MTEGEIRELYPRNRHQLVHACMFLLGLLLVGLIGLASLRHSSDQQVIKAESLRHIVQNLESYSSEAQVVLAQDKRGRTTDAYAGAYIDNLQSLTDSLSADLQEHSVDQSVQSQAARVLHLSGQLSDTLRAVTDAPNEPDFDAAQGSVHSVNLQLQDLENDL
jgi:hypothetical protein